MSAAPIDMKKKLLNTNAIAILRMIKRDPTVRKSKLIITNADTNLIKTMLRSGLLEVTHVGANGDVTMYASFEITPEGERFLEHYEVLVKDLGLHKEVEDAIAHRESIYRMRCCKK